MIASSEAGLKREYLASIVLGSAPDLETEKAAIRDLVAGGSAETDLLFELEVRAQGLLHDVVATGAQVGKGKKYLKATAFPALAKLGLGGGRKEALALRVFSNDCHEAGSGRFCETHGVTHEGGEKPGFFKELFGAFRAGQQGKPRNPEPEVQRNSRGLASGDTDGQGRPISSDTTKNAYGFSPRDLDIEKGAIADMFKKGEKLHLMRLDNRTKWMDNVDAETRAAAVLQGRIAAKGEIKRGRNKAASANFGALILLGIIVT